MSRPLRVVHLPALVGNNAPALARAERELGLDSRAVSFHPSPFGFGDAEIVFGPGDGSWRKERKRWRLLWDLLRDADVVHCNFGRCVMPVLDANPPPGLSLRYEARAALCRLVERLDLRLLRRAGKGIVVTYQGDDARQGDYCLAHYESSFAHGFEPGYYTPRTDARKRRRVRAFADYAHRIYALNPDLLRVLPERAEFLPYAIDPRAWEPVGVEPAPRPLRILHAPTHRGAKGTPHLERSVAELRAAGVAVELEMVEGVSHVEARRRYAGADVVVDQLVSGFYGALAVEAMLLAKPVVAYLNADDLALLPPALRAELPIVSAAPATLTGALQRLAEAPRGELAELGRRGRAFAERWHDPRRIAAGLAEVYHLALQETPGIADKGDLGR